MNTTLSPQAVVDRVRAQITKKASDDGGVASEGDRGAATVPSSPPIDGLPANNTNVDGGRAPYDQTLKPGDTGYAVPSTESQNAKDNAATSPTADLAKIAARVSRITQVAVAGTPAKAAGAPPVAPAPVAPAPVAAQAPAKTAGAPAEAFSADVLTKLGSLLVQQEGGVEYGKALLELEAGEKFACQAIQECVAASQLYEKSAADANDQYLYAVAEQQQWEQHKQAAASEFARIWEASSPAERVTIEFMAKAAAWSDSQPHLAHPLLKAAFGEGMADGAEDMDAMEAGEPEPTGEEDVSPEEIAMLIQHALEAGKIDEATATALMDQLAGGEGQDPNAMEGAPGGEDPAMEEEMKAAAALVR